MDAADSVIWRYADGEGIVPMPSLVEVPDRICRDIWRWLRRQAIPCPHSVGLALEGVYFRVVGRADVWCPACATSARLPELVASCARCGRVVAANGHVTAFSVFGHAIIFGAWCAECWNEEEDE